MDGKLLEIISAHAAAYICQLRVPSNTWNFHVSDAARGVLVNLLHRSAFAIC